MTISGNDIEHHITNNVFTSNMGRTSAPDLKHHGPYAFHIRLHKSTNDYQEAMKLVDKQYLKIIEVQPPINLYAIYPFWVIYKFAQASDPIDHKEKLELKLYTTKLTYSELQTLAMDIRRGNANHDDNVIAEWIKVIPPDDILEYWF